MYEYKIEQVFLYYKAFLFHLSIQKKTQGSLDFF